jgi:hypothetical protein
MRWLLIVADAVLWVDLVNYEKANCRSCEPDVWWNDFFGYGPVDTVAE